MKFRSAVIEAMYRDVKDVLSSETQDLLKTFDNQVVAYLKVLEGNKFDFELLSWHLRRLRTLELDILLQVECDADGQTAHHVMDILKGDYHGRS